MTSKTYRVRPGVDWVNGARVPATRKVSLSDVEARYELDHGRIELPSTKQHTDGGEGSQDGRD
ncbi:hypothetical protein U2P60_01095 [Brucella sp. H1_1004]|uniref:hypothetical protein n=1 Tax=Brucella sp. H1_1004 TaxID=3110109 RepID=UPI0039B5A094